jgi:hypothetical protein
MIGTMIMIVAEERTGTGTEIGTEIEIIIVIVIACEKVETTSGKEIGNITEENVRRKETDIGTEKDAAADHVVVAEAGIAETVIMTHNPVIRSGTVVQVLRTTNEWIKMHWKEIILVAEMNRRRKR